MSGVRVFAGFPCQIAVVRSGRSFSFLLLLYIFLVGDIAGELVSQLVKLY